MMQASMKTTLKSDFDQFKLTPNRFFKHPLRAELFYYHKFQIEHQKSPTDFIYNFQYKFINSIF